MSEEDTAQTIASAIAKASNLKNPDSGPLTALCEDEEFLARHEAVLKQKEAAAAAENDARRRARRIERLAQIPSEYLEPFDRALSKMPTPVIDRCARWKLSERLGIHLGGRSGAGKTRLLVRVLQGLECDFLFMPATKMAKAVREQYDDDFGIANAAYSLLKQARVVPVLLWDDLGMESASKAVVEEIVTIVEERTSYRRPILSTSNKTSAELMEHYGTSGPALVRRLAEFCWTP